MSEGLHQGTLIEVELALVEFDPDQPRTSSEERSLEELARDIRANGLEQPLVLTEQPDPEVAVHKPYRLLHGARRLTAALRGGLTHAPAILRSEGLAADDRIMRQLAENDLREDLNAYDRATAVARAFESSGLSHAEFARKHGKSRPWLSTQLWLAQVQGLTAVALSERWIRHGETARLFAQLPARTQHRLLEGARSTHEPVTLSMVKRLLPRPAADPAATEPPSSTSPDTAPAGAMAIDPPGQANGPTTEVEQPPSVVPVYLRADILPHLLSHFSLRRPLEASDQPALLAAYLESLVQPHLAAVQT